MATERDFTPETVRAMNRELNNMLAILRETRLVDVMGATRCETCGWAQPILATDQDGKGWDRLCVRFSNSEEMTRRNPLAGIPGLNKWGQHNYLYVKDSFGCVEYQQAASKWERHAPDWDDDMDALAGPPSGQKGGDCGIA